MTTYYQVFTGPATMFPEKKGLRPLDIRDGMSHTILVVEAGEAVPWTKPPDLPYDARKPLPRLGGILKDGFQFVTADGALHFARPDRNEQILRAAVTPGGRANDRPSLAGVSCLP